MNTFFHQHHRLLVTGQRIVHLLFAVFRFRVTLFQYIVLFFLCFLLRAAQCRVFFGTCPKE